MYRCFNGLYNCHFSRSGLQYVIDVAAENCSTRAIHNNSVDARTLDKDPSHVHMRHGSDMFSLNTQALKYQGKVCDINIGQIHLEWTTYL